MILLDAGYGHTPPSYTTTTISHPPTGTLPTVPAAHPGSLAFTGSDVVGCLIIAVVLIGVGVFLWAVSKRRAL